MLTQDWLQAKFQCLFAYMDSLQTCTLRDARNKWNIMKQIIFVQVHHCLPGWDSLQTLTKDAPFGQHSKVVSSLPRQTLLANQFGEKCQRKICLVGLVFQNTSRFWMFFCVIVAAWPSSALRCLDEALTLLVGNTKGVAISGNGLASTRRNTMHAPRDAYFYCCLVCVLVKVGCFPKIW